MKRIAIIGAGIAGLTSASEIGRLARAGHDVEATLFEATNRLGGIVETIHKQGFRIELGPDAWVSEKPWARDFAIELGLEDELLPSDDATRKTYILQHGNLNPIPDGMRLMVPSNLNAINTSSLFSEAARQAYADEIHRAAELKSTAPTEDESIGTFVRRHFGKEVLQTIAAPLLSGVLGGDVEQLSAHAVLAPFVQMEREHGSLITALQARTTNKNAIFTTLRSGLGTLIDRITTTIPAAWIRRNTTITAISQASTGWTVEIRSDMSDKARVIPFDAVHIAVPVHIARRLLEPIDATAAALMSMPASSAIVVALGFPDATSLSIPPGFGFLVPPQTGSPLLACTFVDQKFPNRLPPPTLEAPFPRLLRAFFGGSTADALLDCTNADLIALTRQELAQILGPLPAASVEVVRRWPQSLPQYTIGHLERVAKLDRRIAALPGLTLLGNGYRGVGLPDLIRDARVAARSSVI
jgi:oxygen-dependent protoporphyrinogen oxidase